jgi:uncharacterized protein (DUF302 family)
MSLGFSVTVPGTFEEVSARVREALKAEGFGVVSEIDVQATFKQKLDVDFRPYTILGACNPGMAKKAIEAMPEIGLLLPCNVTVEQIEGGVKVTAVNPDAMLSAAPSHPAITEVAADAKPRLERVIASLA